MMPYFWVDVGIFGRVIEKVDDDLSSMRQLLPKSVQL